MTTRTFKQYGQAYGSVPASITATIDGTVVFSGPIPTIDTPIPFDPLIFIDRPTLFTWTNTVEFSGTQSYSITVTGSPLLLVHTLADHCRADDALEFNSFYSRVSEGIVITDPFTNVTIDGVLQQRGPNNSDLPGQWYWLIPADSTFTATLNINAGLEPGIDPGPNPNLI